MGLGNFFKSVGHGIGSIAKQTVKFAKISADEVAKLKPLIPQIEAITAIVSPQAAAIEDLAFHVLGAYGEAAQSVGDAVAANGVNVQLDKEVHDKILAFVASIKDSVAAGLKK